MRVAVLLGLVLLSASMRVSAQEVDSLGSDTAATVSVDSAASADSAVSPDSVAPLVRYKNKFLGVPFIGYSPTTKWVAGVAGAKQFKYGPGAYDPGTRPSAYSAALYASTSGIWGVSLATDVFTLGNRWWVSIRSQQGYSTSNYYGIGPLTANRDTNRVKERLVHFEARVLRGVGSSVFIGPYLRLHAAWGTDFKFADRIPTSLRGGDGTVSSGLGISVQADTRNSLNTPTSGHYAVLDVLANSHLVGSEYDYGYVLIDVRRYLALDRARNHVLALNVYGQFNSAEVPIQTMAALANVTTQNVMRGVYLGRFRDRHTLVAQADYRAHVWWRFGAVLFGAAGNVFGSNGATLGDRMKYTGGGGVRFDLNPRDPLNLRIDYTFTNFGMQGLSIGAGEAF